MNEAKATTTDSIISRLRCGSKHSILNVADEAADEIERLRKERDEARRMACEKEETLGCDERGVPRNGSARDHAKQRGWDCFNEDTND